MPALITSSWHLKFVRGTPIVPTDHYVADAVERFGNAARLAQLYEGSAQLADDTLAALAAWLNNIGRPAKTLGSVAPGAGVTTAGPFSALPQRARGAPALE